MTPGEGASDAGAMSVGEEDQLREIEMEHEQRQQDDGVPPARPKAPPAAGAAPAESAKHPWTDRADEPDHPGQISEGGLGGSGPVQP